MNIDHDVKKGDSYVSSGYVIKNSHILSQHIDVDVEMGDGSSGYGFMYSHTDLQHTGLESLINYNDRIDKDMNETLQNGDMSSGIGLINSHILLQYNEPIKPE